MIRTPEERAALLAELHEEELQELAEIAAEKARRDALAREGRGREWLADEPPRPVHVNVDVETVYGTIRVPATIDPATARAIRMEEAGCEQDADGEWHGGFYPVGGPDGGMT